MELARRRFLKGSIGALLGQSRPSVPILESQGLTHIGCAPSTEQTDEDLIYFDQAGLPVQRDCDGGDTAQRVGWMWLGIYLRSRLGRPWHISPPIDFARMLSLIEPHQDGLFIRHPVKWNDPNDFSRDQSMPLIASMGLLGTPQPLSRMWSGVLARRYRFQNGDLCAPEHVNLFNRARRLSPKTLGDLQLVGSSVARTALGLNMDDVGDDLNHIVSLILARFRAPTSLVDLAIRIYARHRPHSFGSYLGSYRKAYGSAYDTPHAVMTARIDAGIGSGWQPDKNVSPVFGAVRWYFRRETSGSPALAELYGPIIRRWLS